MVGGERWGTFDGVDGVGGLHVSVAFDGTMRRAPGDGHPETGGDIHHPCALGLVGVKDGRRRGCSN